MGEDFLLEVETADFCCDTDALLPVGLLDAGLPTDFETGEDEDIGIDPATAVDEGNFGFIGVCPEFFEFVTNEA